MIDAGVGFVNPDNIGVSHGSLMIQEDSTGSNEVWQHPIGTTTWTKVASTTQVATAETSGIVDASKWLGDGWWALSVQSHVNLPTPTCANHCLSAGRGRRIRSVPPSDPSTSPRAGMASCC